MSKISCRLLANEKTGSEYNDLYDKIIYLNIVLSGEKTFKETLNLV